MKCYGRIPRFRSTTLPTYSWSTLNMEVGLYIETVATDYDTIWPHNVEHNSEQSLPWKPNNLSNDKFSSK
jgi:hypothetical protein